MHSLPVFVRLDGRKVVIIGESDAAQAKRRLVERAGAIIVDAAEAADAALVFVALDDAAAAAQAAQHFRALGKLVNVVDRPDLCDFTTPAIVDRSPVLIAIGTGGASAGLAAALRQRLEQIVPASLGGVATALADARARLRQLWPDMDDRRHALQAALSASGAIDPLVDHAQTAAVQSWLDASANDVTAEPGTLAVVRIDSDDPELLTLRDARLLACADHVWHDGRAPGAILSRARADAVQHVAPQPPPAPHDGRVVWIDVGANL